ncbi:MAG: imidazole glycerol phosphate synthase subunit HisH [Bacteroidetes bacterium]|nr:imidazole glycerol phosphate synthase subunit HisH [Bacteroidota bacterium]
MKIVLIDYRAGNVQSVLFALERLGVNATLSNDAAEIASADKVIFPGVGEASTAMQVLHKQQLNTLIPQLKQPVLGICLGMQLLCRHSEEGDTAALGVFDVDVKRFVPQPADAFQKVPHMGWNTLDVMRGPLFEGLPEKAAVYFVHSFYAALCTDTAAEANYNMPFSAALCRDNFYAVQFHPEKSGEAGERILQNFLQR